MQETRSVISQLQCDVSLGPGRACVGHGPLVGTRVDNGRLELQVDLAGARASLLELRDNLQAGLIGNLAKDDVLSIEPGGDDGGDEELGTIAVVKKLVSTDRN